MLHGARSWVTAMAAIGLAGCLGTPAPDPLAGTPVVGEVVPQPTWPDAADCRTLVMAVLAMPEAERGLLPMADAPLGLAVVDGTTFLDEGEAAAAIELDLPVPIVQRADGLPCLVMAERPRLLPEGGRRLVWHETVHAEHRSGTRRGPNPEYERLKAEAEAAEEDGPERVLATGDPALDLIGLIGGAIIDRAGRLWSDRRAARAELARTERHVEIPIYTPYTYEISAFQVARSGALRAALVDVIAGQAYEARHTVRELSTVPVAEGRHHADRGILDGTGPEAVLAEDLAVIEATPPRPRLGELLVALAGTEAVARAAGPEEALAALKPDPAPAEGLRRVVAVETLSGPAEGTWLDKDHIAVPTEAVGRSSLVRFTSPDGARIFGLVERVDEASGQAVVRVGRSDGTPPLTGEALAEALRELKSR